MEKHRVPPRNLSPPQFERLLRLLADVAGSIRPQVWIEIVGDSIGLPLRR